MGRGSEKGTYMATTTETEQTVTVTVGENDISFSTGRLAKQADGAVLVSSGETRVLATAVGRTEAREGIDFFPLTVDIEEKMYAAGKIPGGFFKREGKAPSARRSTRAWSTGRSGRSGRRDSATRCRSSARCSRPTSSPRTTCSRSTAPRPR